MLIDDCLYDEMFNNDDNREEEILKKIPQHIILI